MNSLFNLFNHQLYVELVGYKKPNSLDILIDRVLKVYDSELKLKRIIEKKEQTGKIFDKFDERQLMIAHNKTIGTSMHLFGTFIDRDFLISALSGDADARREIRTRYNMTYQQKGIAADTGGIMDRIATNTKYPSSYLSQK